MVLEFVLLQKWNLKDEDGHISIPTCDILQQ